MPRASHDVAGNVGWRYLRLHAASHYQLPFPAVGSISATQAQLSRKLKIFQAVLNLPDINLRKKRVSTTRALRMLNIDYRPTTDAGGYAFGLDTRAAQKPSS
jgi:hypothetical protein